MGGTISRRGIRNEAGASLLQLESQRANGVGASGPTCDALDVERRTSGRAAQSASATAEHGILRSIGPAGCRHSPEESACLLCRLLFTWAFPVMWLGYRRGRLDLLDLPHLPCPDQPAVLGGKVCSFLRAQIERPPTSGLGRGRTAVDLRYILLKLVLPIWAEAFVYQIIMSCAQFVQPVLLHSLLAGLIEKREDSSPVVDGLLLAFAVMIQWVFAEYAWIQFIKGDLRCQCALVHLVFRKGLHMPSSGTTYTLGKLQNLFATDCTKAPQSFLTYSLTSLFVALLTLCVAAWHLTDLVGSAGLVGMAIIAILGPAQYMLTWYTKRMTYKMQLARDSRGRLFSQFLSAMRVVKCFCLEDVALNQISEVRRDELKWQWRRRLVFPFNNFIASSASLFGTAATFSWMVLVLERPLDPALAFTILSWSNLLKAALLGVPNACVQMIDVYVSVKRVETLLSSPTENPWDWLQQLCGGPATIQSLPPLSCSVTALDKDRQRAPEIHLEHCDVGYSLGSDRHSGVHDVSFSVLPGELLLVIGPIGSGKSVLLEACAGTRKQLAGEMTRDGTRSYAYVSQRPWLLNATLLENILFGCVLDEDRLQTVLECCALLPDLDSLPDGLRTVVGEEGVQLSGGQKQRVSLARAVYSGAEVVIMDDVLSALDAHVGRKVWESAICGVLCGRTRIVATHQVHYAAHAAVSRVLILGATGKVQHVGPPAELRAHGVVCGGAEEQAGTPGEVDEIHTVSSRGAAEGEASASPSSLLGHRGRGIAATDPHAEIRRLGAVRHEDFLEYARACGGLQAVLLLLILLLCYYGFLLASNFALAAWSSPQSGTATTRGGRADLEMYLWLALATGTSCLLFFLGIQVVSLRSSRVLHESFARSLLRAELRFFDTTPLGRILNRCLKDFQLLDDTMPAACRTVVESIMNFVISFVILATFAWQSLLAVPFFAAIYWYVMNVYRWPARDLKRLESLSRSPMMSHFADSVRGSMTIRAYGAAERFIHQNLVLMGDTQRTSYWYWSAQGWVSMVQEVLGTFLLAAICATICYRASIGALSPGLAGLSLSYALSMPRDLMWLSRRLASIEVEFVSVERLLEYIRLPQEVTTLPPELQPARGFQHPAICASAVCMRYANDLPLVLNELSLSIPAGARAAIVGRTGCGKSSLLSALARLYPVSEGSLRVHGADIMKMPLAKLRRTVRVLLQDPIFFSGTVRSNLLCCVPYKEDGGHTPCAVGRTEESELWRVLGQAGLEHRIRALPNGLDHRVDDGGMNFSHGERQLLCLARVLVDPSEPHCHQRGNFGSRILLCDEPTSSCDLATDERIHETIFRGLPTEWTLVVICHRLHRIREFDTVHVLANGRVVEEGTPSKLLDAGHVDGSPSTGGLLRGMCQHQGVV